MLFFCVLKQLTRKNLMVKNLKRYQKNLEKDAGRVEAIKCDFYPCTFALPSEYHLFVEEFNRSPGSIWIMKPVSLNGAQIWDRRYSALYLENPRNKNVFIFETIWWFSGSKISRQRNFPV